MANLSHYEEAQLDHFADEVTQKKASADPWCLPGRYHVKFGNVYDELTPATKQDGTPTKFPGSWSFTATAYVQGTSVKLRKQRFTPEPLQDDNDSLFKSFVIFSNYANAIGKNVKTDVKNIVEHMETVGVNWRLGLMATKEDSAPKFLGDDSLVDELVKCGYTIGNYLTKDSKSITLVED